MSNPNPALAYLSILPATISGGAVYNIPLNTTPNQNGSVTLNQAVNVQTDDNKVKIELPQGTIVSGINLPAGGVQLAYVPNHTATPGGIALPFAGRHFDLKLVASTPPYTPITPVTFNPPLKITVFYDPAELAATGIDPQRMKIVYRSTGASSWTEVAESDIIQRGAGTTAADSFVIFQVSHLTDFALTGPLKLYFPVISLIVTWLRLLPLPSFSSPAAAQRQSGLTYTTYLPVVIDKACSLPAVPSPFSLQIAALHQVAGSQIAALRQKEGGVAEPTLHALTQAEWLAVYEAAFPTLMEALKERGAGWVRVRVNWSWIEPNAPQAGQPPAYVWGPYHDDKLRLVGETGVRMIATVADAPGWVAASPCAPIYPDRLDEFAQFLTDLVNRYKQPPYNIKHLMGKGRPMRPMALIWWPKLPTFVTGCGLALA